MNILLRCLCRVTIGAMLLAGPGFCQILPSVKAISDSRGSIRAGDLIFSNFQAPSLLPFNHPQGALPNDASDIGVSVVVHTDGRVGVVFTPINPLTGAPNPLFINAQRGSTAPSNLVRNITFDVASSNPSLLLHSLTLAHGPSSRWFGDATVANLAYYVEPGTGAAGLLVLDSLNSQNLTAALPGGDLPSFRFGDELELVSNHNRGGSTGTASVDLVEVSFSLVPSGAAVPPVVVVPSFVGANAVLSGSAATGFVRLNVPAQSGGALVTLRSNDPTTVSLPSAITVPQGALTASFPITAGPAPSGGISVGVSASTGGTTITGFIQVFPAPPLALSSLVLTPTTVIGGATAGGVVTMNIPAQSAPATVTLASNSAAVVVPPFVQVPPGASSIGFPITTSTVGAATNILVTATYNSVSLASSITLNPAPPVPLNTFVLSVGKSGSGVVTATPSGNDHPLNCGNVCSATFNQGTNVTLVATPPANKTFVSWSGDCTGVTSVCSVVVSKSTSVQAQFK